MTRPGKAATGLDDVLMVVAVIGGFIKEPANAPSVECFNRAPEDGIGDQVDVDFSTFGADHAAPCAVDGVPDPATGEALPGQFPPRANRCQKIRDVRDGKQVGK